LQYFVWQAHEPGLGYLVSYLALLLTALGLLTLLLLLLLLLTMAGFDAIVFNHCFVRLAPHFWNLFKKKKKHFNFLFLMPWFYLLFVICYLLCVICYLLFVIWYLVFGIWYVVFGICYHVTQGSHDK
jgi:hypothetical protein